MNGNIFDRVPRLKLSELIIEQWESGLKFGV